MKPQNNTSDFCNTGTTNYRLFHRAAQYLSFFNLSFLCASFFSLPLLGLFFLATYSNNIIAEETPNLAKPKIIVPEKISGVTTLSAEQVLEILMSEHPPLLVDARIKQDRDYGYIESSISLPDIETNCNTLTKIVSKNKNKPIIFYCNGVQCGRSVVSIKIARSCGYHHLSWFKGGFAEWKEKGYQYITHK
jgi:rhodanese-related sulfurtransferase